MKIKNVKSLTCHPEGIYGLYTEQPHQAFWFKHHLMKPLKEITVPE